jgi:hypothetical protein
MHGPVTFLRLEARLRRDEERRKRKRKSRS